MRLVRTFACRYDDDGTEVIVEHWGEAPYVDAGSDKNDIGSQTTIRNKFQTSSGTQCITHDKGCTFVETVTERKLSRILDDSRD